MSNDAYIQLQVSSTNNFNNLIIDKSIQYTGTDRVPLVASDFPEIGNNRYDIPFNATLYMRTRYSNVSETSPWSKVVAFMFYDAWLKYPTLIGSSIETVGTKTNHLSSVLLTDDKVILAYSNNDDGGKLYSRVLTVQDMTVTMGTIVKCNNVKTSNISIHKISDTRVTVVYLNEESKKPEAISLQISGSSISTGTISVLSNIETSSVHADILNTTSTQTRIVVGTSSLDPNFTEPYDQRYTQSTTVPIPHGVSSITIKGRGAGRSSAGYDYEIVPAYTGSSNLYGASGWSFSGGFWLHFHTNDGWETTTTEPGATTHVNVYMSPKTKISDFIHQYEGTHPATGETMVVAWRTIPQYNAGSNTTVVISGGSTYTFNGSNAAGTNYPAEKTYSNIPVVGGSTTLTMSMNSSSSGGYVTLIYDAHKSVPHAQLLTVTNSNGTLSVGTIKSSNINIAAKSMHVVGMSTSALFLYLDSGNDDKIMTNAVNASLVFSSTKTLSTKRGEFISVFPLDNTKAVVAYNSRSDSGKIYGQIVTVSGSNVTTSGTETLLTSSNSAHLAFAQNSYTKPILVYCSASHTYRSYVTVLTISSGGNITNSEPVQCNADLTNTSQIQPILLRTDRMILTHVSRGTTAKTFSQIIQS